MRVTARRIHLRAAFETVRFLPWLLRQFYCEIKLTYLRYDNAMLRAYLKNPDVTWSKVKE